MISKNTAMDIALAYREVEAAEKLLADITDALTKHKAPDIRDGFGRLQDGITLGVPMSSDSNRRLFNVPYSLAVPIIEAHIAHHRAKIRALIEKARHEIEDQRGLFPGEALDPSLFKGGQ